MCQLMIGCVAGLLSTLDLNYNHMFDFSTKQANVSLEMQKFLGLLALKPSLRPGAHSRPSLIREQVEYFMRIRLLHVFNS